LKGSSDDLWPTKTEHEKQRGYPQHEEQDSGVSSDGLGGEMLRRSTIPEYLDILEGCGLKLRTDILPS